MSRQDVLCHRLHTSHAFHSERMEPILAPFTEQVAQIGLSAPGIPYLSNVTGTWITAEEATDPGYWAKHLRQTVRFADGIRELVQDPSRILLEIGPGQTLATLAKRHPDKAREQVVLSSLRRPEDRQSDVAFLLNTLGKLWLAGGEIDWSGFYADQDRHRLPLPTYPFERRRYWIDPPNVRQPMQQGATPRVEPPGKVESTPSHSRTNLMNTYVAPRNELERIIADAWGKSLGIEKVGIYDDFFELGGDSLLAVQLISQLKYIVHADLTLSHIIDAPSVTQLASFIGKMRASCQQENSILVNIRPHGSGIPLFCIHPAGGAVFPYVNLAHYLDSEQPVYGIQSPAFVGKEEYSNLAERAIHYIEAIKSVHSKGPYFLAGMSYGGNMAVEMAIQLKNMGDDVGFVALFDSYPPRSYQDQAEDDHSFLLAFLAAAEAMFGNNGKLREVLPDNLQQFGEDELWNHIIRECG